jgi:cytochrome c-type biogenesis protein CcsB
MNRFLNFFLSSKATMVLLALIAIAMAVATFIEDKYDTITSKYLVYNTIWFELLFVLLIINLFGHIKTYNLLSMKKLGGLIFHLAFIVMIIGAAITRYFGFEGSMHIREGESSNIIYSAETYLMIFYNDGNKDYNYDFPINIGSITNNSFNTSIPNGEKGKIEIKYKDIIYNAIEKLEENIAGGENIIQLSTLTPSGMQTVLIKEGQISNLGSINIAYNNDKDVNAVRIIEKDGIIYISSPYDIIQSTMSESETDTLSKDSSSVFKENYIYHVNNATFVYSKFYKSAKKTIVAGTMGEKGEDAILLDIAINGKNYESMVIYDSENSTGNYNQNFDGTNIKLRYGNKLVEVPFSLYLNDFILEKYPGSESPSSYKSEVTLIDEKNNVKEDHSIYMNNVLDYEKYRFFQSSYDNDLKGTVLSVNHDFWGTVVSYFGYFLLTLGFIFTLFNKNSRFLSLRKLIIDARNKRKAIVLSIILLIGINGIGFSQSNANKIIDAKHADNFGRLFAQTYDGRFAPVQTLAIDLMHKISKKENFTIEGKGKMNAMQVFIDMMAEPQFWQQQKIIYIPQKAIREIVGINTEYASFTDFFDASQNYKLDKYISASFQKKQTEKNKFDKEILKVDERLNIFYMILNGSILKIFPEQDSKNNKWISWDDNPAMIPLTGAISIINEDLQLKTLNYHNLMQAYIFEVQKAMNTNDYSKAEKIISYISDIQKQKSDPTILPSDSRKNAEIFYNNANIFIFLKNLYALLSVLLLLLAFIDNVKSKRNKYIVYSLNTFTILLGVGFLYHTLGMGLRWYITGHAPWANGYEALILVAWGALLAGFSFAKNSKITLAATTLLAFFVLMTASHSSYDPQLTNLQPVLKSYWLIIHVATLTISYGFFGLGFILGIMNLIIILFKTDKNHKRFDLLISENSYIIEMNLIIGLMLATLGTFLGAVWANESWGRYWGWDAKETWALIIVVAYSIVIHMRFIPRLNTKYAFNVASVLGFASVIMTFVGVNYYLSKGMHSYGAGDTPIFPLWAWGTIFALFIIIISSGIKEKNDKIKFN